MNSKADLDITPTVIQESVSFEIAMNTKCLQRNFALQSKGALRWCNNIPQKRIISVFLRVVQFRGSSVVRIRRLNSELHETIASSLASVMFMDQRLEKV